MRPSNKADQRKRLTRFLELVAGGTPLPEAARLAELTEGERVTIQTRLMERLRQRRELRTERELVTISQAMRALSAEE